MCSRRVMEGGSDSGPVFVDPDLRPDSDPGGWVDGAGVATLTAISGSELLYRRGAGRVRGVLLSGSV